MANDNFRLPSDSQRLAVIGRTGSGKTQAAVWHLSNRRYDLMPWIVFNFKGDQLINDIPGTRDLDLSDSVPSNPGVYVVSVAPDEKEAADGFLMRCWAHENVGLYIDEGYMLTGLPGFRRCLTQGRSKHLPMIILSQRPVFMDRFTWTEADFFQVFSLSISDDKKSLAGYIGGNALRRVPDYHSWWYDVARDRMIGLRPVPDADTILATFRKRLLPVRRAI